MYYAILCQIKFMLCYVIMLLITSKHICRKKLSRWLLYPRVTSFDAIKQSTGICAHAITLSSIKYITLNKLSCFQSKHTFWEVKERTSFLFKISLSTSVCVPPLFILADASFDACHWLFPKTNTGCTLYCTRKTSSSDRNCTNTLRHQYLKVFLWWKIALTHSGINI